MKKTYLLILAAIALIGCSKHNPDNTLDPNAWISDESLPVPIMFGATGTEQMTKAAFDGISLPEGTQVGILGLQHKPSDDDPDYEAWKATEAASKSVLVDNSKSALIDADGLIVFNEKKFYPTDNSQNFTFYGYYPFSSEDGRVGNIQPGYNYFEIRYKLDGQTDILWAKAQAESFEYEGSYIEGFNGGYIRKAIKKGLSKDKYLPNLKFEHKLTYLDFKLEVLDESLEELKALNLKVTGLTLQNVFTSAKLVIAKNDDNIEGNPSGTLYGVEPKSNISLTGVEQPIVMNSVGKQDFGNGMLVVPESEYKAQLEMTVDGRTTPLTADLSFSLGEGKTFEAGKKYNLIIVVRAPKEIVIKTELADWETTDDVTIDQINQD